MKWHVERQILWEVTREMVGQGLVSGSNGNASLLLSGNPSEERVLITPSGRHYRQLEPRDLVVIDLDGEPVEGELLPSIESALHLALYRARKDIGAVIHTHSLFASVVGVAGLEIPPLIDEMVMKVGGSVKVAEYAFPSTEELAHRACRALEDRTAVLLRNHGMVGVGRTPWEALEVCQLVEQVAQIFVYASLLGKPAPLPSGIVQMAQDLFRMQRAVENQGIGRERGSRGNGYGDGP